MATIPVAVSPLRSEARFFFVTAWLMAALIVAGFALNIILGNSSFGMPWLVHFHAWTMMGWVGLYLAQNTLVFTNNIALHRRLGWLSVIWLPLIVVMGLLITRHALQTGGGPPFFAQNQFLFSNPLALCVAVGLAAWAVTVRRNTGWHRRLMFCSFAILTGPGIGRLLPGPPLVPYAWYVEGILPAILFPLIGIVADIRRVGRPHPAWFWGIGIVVGAQIVADLVAYSPWGIEFTRQFVAGTPGAERPMAAFIPGG